MNEQEERARYDRRAREREARRKRRRNAVIAKSVILAALVVVLIVAIWFVTGGNKKSSSSEGEFVATESTVESSSVQQEEPETSIIDEAEKKAESESSTAIRDLDPASRDGLMASAASLAMQYDYDGALEVLNSIEGAQEDQEILSMMADYETQKSNLVATPPSQVTHIFFHSLVVDPARGFSITDDEYWNTATAGFCQWMTTVYEFDQIMQQMYDRGYVIVSLYDMIDITTDENGVEHVTPKNIYLPQGKTPFVMSLDDLSYYHSYNGRGCATRMIVGDDGKPTCEYVDENGQTLVGPYDCIPRFDAFLEEHPDFSYKGAKGTVALTGYNGILGYRTDFCYRDRVDLSADQEAYLESNPSFDWNAECEAAKAVAQAILDDGWTFASHTWGHIRIGDAGLDWVMTDTQKWLEQVAPLIGGSDIVIFAHGQDLASWNEDYASTEKFQFMKSQGFTIYCNVDSSQYFVQIGDEFLRMGRRNLDGYRIWQAVYGGDDKVSDLIDAASVIDPQRPTDESLYQL